MELFSTRAVVKSFKAGRKTFKADTAVWVQGTHKTMPKTVPEGCVMLGKMKDTVGNGIVVTIAQAEEYTAHEL